jgi:hypothetical protein
MEQGRSMEDWTLDELIATCIATWRQRQRRMQELIQGSMVVDSSQVRSPSLDEQLDQLKAELKRRVPNDREREELLGEHGLHGEELSFFTR